MLRVGSRRLRVLRHAANEQPVKREAKMTRMRRVSIMVLLVAACISLPLGAEGLHEKLAFLEPRLGGPWQGELTLPDGKRTLPITQAYEAL